MPCNSPAGNQTLYGTHFHFNGTHFIIYISIMHIMGLHDAILWILVEFPTIHMYSSGL